MTPSASTRNRPLKSRTIKIRQAAMNPHTPRCHSRVTRARREFGREACCGFGGLAFASLLHDEQLRAATANPLMAKRSHHPAKAKAVIFLFMAGGPSHIETFDPKPLLNKLNGQK